MLLIYFPHRQGCGFRMITTVYMPPAAAGTTMQETLLVTEGVAHQCCTGQGHWGYSAIAQVQLSCSSDGSTDSADISNINNVISEALIRTGAPIDAALAGGSWEVGWCTRQYCATFIVVLSVIL